MRTIPWAYGAWLVLASGLGAVAWAARTPMSDPSLQIAPPNSRARPAVVAPVYPTDSLGATAVMHDVFRSERRPAAALYDPFRAAAGPPPQPGPAPKPALLLEGIVWGAVPEAVLEGIPGADGPRVLRVGEALGGLRVQRIDMRVVVIAGLDTTWTLTLRYPWR
jgi:hypothetical protein